MAILIISSRCLVKLVTARPVSAVRHARPLYSSGDLRLSVVWRSADLSLSVSACYIARGFQRQGMQQCRGLVEGRGCGLLSEGEGGGGSAPLRHLPVIVDVVVVFGGLVVVSCVKTILNQNVSLKALK